MNPGADELCEGLTDEDCDGVVDESGASDAPIWYIDGDEDSFGRDAGVISSCDQPSGTIARGGDCDDGDASVHPGATEICDGVDTDCDGLDDTEDPDLEQIWYSDVDGDGFGDIESPKTLVSCDTPPGYADVTGDCDDLDAHTFPGATEICDGVPNDCDQPEKVESGVTVDGTSNYSSVLRALAGASSGSELVVCEGTYRGNLSVEVDVVLRSLSGPEVTILQGTGGSGVVSVGSGVELQIEGFTITGGTGTYSSSADQVYGGGIGGFEGGDLTVSDCIIEDNSAYLGGGIMAPVWE